MPKTRPQATCHPGEPHFAFGMCRHCYSVDNYQRNREKRLAQCKVYQDANKDRRRGWAKARRSRHVAHDNVLRYGITKAIWETQWEAQGKKCAICSAITNKGGKAFATDHDHSTGKFRGILCTSCNAGIGQLKDDPVLIQFALEYLLRYGTAVQGASA